MKYIYLFIGLFFLSACEDVTREPFVTDNENPGQVRDVVVKPTPGGAEISYTLPSDMDLLYIEAKYVLPNGEEVIINASGNSRILKIEGFAEVKEYELCLTSVDTSGNRSEPYFVKVTPDTPPVISVFNTIEVQPDFGGLNLQWKNPTEADLAILINMKNEDGEFENIDTYYTSAKDGNYSVRGLEDVESEFSIQIRDKWSNYSDVRTEVLTPLFETLIPSENFELLDYAYTYNLPTSDYSILPHIWDGDLHERNVTDASKMPWYVSFAISDKPIRLSRLVFWQMGWAFNNYGHYYAGNNGRVFEVYGTADEIPTIDMSGWKLLMTCEIVKPSGLPFVIGRDNMTDEDFELAHNIGHEFVLPLDIPSVRCLRVRSIDGFGGGLGTFAELQVYGDPN